MPLLKPIRPSSRLLLGRAPPRTLIPIAHARAHHQRFAASQRPNPNLTPYPLAIPTQPHQRARYSTSPPPPPPPTDEPKHYTASSLQQLPPHTLIIDVREPSELAQTGKVPGSVNMPLTSNPDAFYLGEEEFRERFGFERPRARTAGREGGKGGGGGGGGGGREKVDMRAGQVGEVTGTSPFTPQMKGREAKSGLGGEGLDGGIGRHRGAGAGVDGEVDEVVFYCKAGVRSRAAARMAREWKGVKVGDMKGGWDEWSSRGGDVERV